MGTPMRRRSEKCLRCGITLVFSKCSESERRLETIESFNCPACGYEFGTTDNLIEGAPLNAELIEEFFPGFVSRLKLGSALEADRQKSKQGVHYGSNSIDGLLQPWDDLRKMRRWIDCSRMVRIFE